MLSANSGNPRTITFDAVVLFGCSIKKTGCSESRLPEHRPALQEGVPGPVSHAKGANAIGNERETSTNPSPAVEVHDIARDQQALFQIEILDLVP